MTPAQAEWARCRPWFEAAVAQGPGLETVEGLERGIAEGRYGFWWGDDSAVVWEIRPYENKKVLVIIAGGGDLDELLGTLEPRLCEAARKMGCDAIMGEGRKGWERVTVKNGYRLGFVTMIKDLEH